MKIIKQTYSINFDKFERSPRGIDYVIFHYTGMLSEKKAIKRLANKNSKVSCHYFIKRDGSIINMIPDKFVAWHAGLSCWKRHKNLNIVFTRNGYFNSEAEKTKTFNNISTSKANLVIVGMGSPLQEEFSILIKKSVQDKLLIFTCGGFLSQTSKNINYYHPFVIKLGLRWLQRVFLHKHVRKRIIKYYPRFVFNYIKSNIFNN